MPLPIPNEPEPRRTPAPRAAAPSPTEAPRTYFSLLALAVGAASPDGADLTKSDVRALRAIDARLQAVEAEQGAEEARAALVRVLQILIDEQVPEVEAKAKPSVRASKRASAPAASRLLRRGR